MAAALALARQGRLRPDDEVVLCITGNGLKTIDAARSALSRVPVIDPKLREVSALVAAAGSREDGGVIDAITQPEEV